MMQYSLLNDFLQKLDLMTLCTFWPHAFTKLAIAKEHTGCSKAKDVPPLSAAFFLQNAAFI